MFYVFLSLICVTMKQHLPLLTHMNRGAFMVSSSKDYYLDFWLLFRFKAYAYLLYIMSWSLGKEVQPELRQVFSVTIIFIGWGGFILF